MIKAIHLRNFQSHKNTSLRFDKGVNSIVGLSDSGKSAILRAFNWVINNKPSGEEFKSYWGGDTEVIVELDTYQITRGRGKKGNYYILEGVDGYTQEFKAFGQDVPKEITSVLNMSDINMSYQMDAPFLIGSSPGEVAQILNKTVNLDVIDSAVSNIRKKKGQAEQEYKHAREESEKLTSKLKEFEYLQEAEIAVSKLEEYCSLLETNRTRQNQIYHLQTAIHTQSEKLKTFQIKLSAKDQIEEAMRLQGKQHILATSIRVLSDITNRCLSLEAEAGHISDIVGANQSILAASFLAEKGKVVAKNAARIRSIVRDIFRAEARLGTCQEELETLEKDFHKYMPDICPLCGAQQSVGE